MACATLVDSMAANARRTVDLRTISRTFPPGSQRFATDVRNAKHYTTFDNGELISPVNLSRKCLSLPSVSPGPSPDSSSLHGPECNHYPTRSIFSPAVVQGLQESTASFI